jgi:MFS family permease
MTCPACGMVLPANARFCSQCGVAQPQPRRPVAVWVIVVFGVGVVLTALVATTYSAIALFPSAAGSSLDPATLRTGSTILGVGVGILCVLQSVAIVGLVRGREWGRVVATAACVLWSITCLGLPVAILILNSLWRGSPPKAAAPPV